MGLRTPEQFLDGLRDDRTVYYRGQRVKAVPDHPELGVAARHAAIDFQLAENPKFRELAVHREGGEEYSAYYRDTAQRERPDGAVEVDRNGYNGGRHPSHPDQGNRNRCAIRAPACACPKWGRNRSGASGCFLQNVPRP